MWENFCWLETSSVQIGFCSLLKMPNFDIQDDLTRLFWKYYFKAKTFFSIKSFRRNFMIMKRSLFPSTFLQTLLLKALEFLKTYVSIWLQLIESSTSSSNFSESRSRKRQYEIFETNRKKSCKTLSKSQKIKQEIFPPYSLNLFSGLDFSIYFETWIISSPKIFWLFFVQFEIWQENLF